MLINIDLGNLIIMLVIGLAAGFLANLIIGRRNSSLLNSFLVGIAGAFIGGWLLPMIGLRPWGVVGNFVTATVGATMRGLQSWQRPPDWLIKSVEQVFDVG